jgi:SpoIID/LytB domain protein
MSRRLLATGVVAAVLGAGGVAAGTASTVPASTTTATRAPGTGQTYYVPVTKKLTVVGHGYGHGHGMSQNGAQGAALQGKRYREILSFYYPGTELGSNKGLIRVLLTADTTSDVVVQPARGLEVRDLGAGTSLDIPEQDGATQWRLTPAAADPSRTVVQYRNARGWHRWRTLAGDGQFSADVPLALVLPDGSTRRYRGLLRAASPYAGAAVRDTVNALPMDDYVRGVIADEMPASWHQQALRSQAVAARTYASYTQRAASGRYYQICDTTSCQVYGGVAAETPTTDRAVARTAGRVLLDGRYPAFTQFSASSGGWTSDGGQSYLPAQRDPWDGWEGNPNSDWSTTISVESLESAFGQLGRLEAIRVTRRDGHGAWGGRVQQVVLEGSADTVALTGDDIRWRYGLRSSWFSFEPTPIIATWRDLGGRRSILGAPTSAEVAVESAFGATGARQLFEKGRAYWTPRNGAAAVAGPVLSRYRKLGGPASEYGFPRSTVAETADGAGLKLRLARGMIFWSADSGARAVRGKVLEAYRKRKYSAGPLGYPVSDFVDTDTEQRGRFQGGSVVYDKSTKKTTVTLRD